MFLPFASVCKTCLVVFAFNLALASYLQILVQFAEESCLSQFQLGGILEALPLTNVGLFYCKYFIWFLNVSVVHPASRFSCKSL